MRTTLLTIFFLVWLVPDSDARPAIVVIDAGHGGTNLGAHSAQGVLEKRVTLRAARMLKRHLKRPGLRVILTRTRDRYLTLAERVRRANRAGADVFVSLHCNASPGRNQRGYEAYVASPAGMAHQQRPVSRAPLRWPDLAAPKTVTRLEVAAALQDLGRQSRRRRSLALGRDVMQSLKATLGAAGDRGLQQAPFDVLLGLHMPGLLVELGFLDHPREGARLVTSAYLERVTEAIARGILRHLRRTFGLRLARPNARVDSDPPMPPSHRRDHRRPAPGEPSRRRRNKPVVAYEPAA